MATQPTPVEAHGIVAVLRGNAWLIRADGTRVALKVGDEVQAGQHIITEEGTRLELTLPNGQPLTIGAARELVIDANLLGLAPIDKTEAALTNLNSGATQIAQAIASGGDLSTQLEATAAGLAGGEGSDQHGFVRVLSLSEDLLRSQVALSLSRDAVATSAPGIDGTSAANTVTPVTPVTPVTTVNGPPSAGAGQATVFEQGLANAADTSESTTGRIAVSAPAGLGSVTLDGVTFTAAQLADAAYLAAHTINTGEGTLTLTGYNASTGALSYSYTLKAAQSHTGANANASLDNIALTVTDANNVSANGTLGVNIVDSTPLAAAKPTPSPRTAPPPA